MAAPLFHKPEASFHTRDSLSLEDALRGTTHLAIGAHADDLEIMAFHGIAHCANHPEDRFSGITCTDGRGSPRGGTHAKTAPDSLRSLRRAEQLEAARLGRYNAIVQLDYSSPALRGADAPHLTRDLENLLRHASPRVLYTHNPFDVHSTHLAVLRSVLTALRALPPTQRPRELYGCEVWRSLDWLPSEFLVELEVPPFPLWPQLLACFRSQIDAGKRYDLAAPARALANATFRKPRAIDAGPRWLAVNLQPLLREPDLTLAAFAERVLGRFRTQVLDNLQGGGRP